MFRVVFSRPANRDIDEIFYDIAILGFPENAERFVDAIYDFCLGLKIGPHRGTRRPQLGKDVRSFGFHKQVTIAFRVSEKEKSVTILRILRRGRSLEKAFKRAR